MLINLFKSFSKQRNTLQLSKTSVSNELNSLLHELTIDRNTDHENSNTDYLSKEEPKYIATDLERQIEENQIMYAKIMNERLGGRF
ncbi:hypothetical protein [Maribacter sp. Asnod1-A12]|uniref:hypothetical protein n=1 Tax=Maribacter sp. Asnod1-A12 TaxID=3160576 RepID=UPI00386DD6C5